jgi:hypothetical protein
MNQTVLQKPFFLAIKITSTLLITIAIVLEGWNLITPFSEIPFFVHFYLLIWFTRFALIAHGIEAMIATVYAPAKGKTAIPYAVYTFFVGTVGLWELFDPELPLTHRD